MVVIPSVRVNVHALSAQASAHQSLALNPHVPLGNALAPALPNLGVSASPLLKPMKVTSVAGSAQASPFRMLVGGGISHLNVVRNNQFIPLNPQKTAAQQGIRDGDNLSFLGFSKTTASPTYHDIQKMLFLLQIKQGDLEKAQENLLKVTDQERQSKQRERMLGYILKLFAFLVVITVGIIIADGLHSWGFKLTTFVRNSFMVSVLGEVSALVTIAFYHVFSPTKSDNTNAS